MPIRVSHTVAVRTSRDTDYKQAMWDPDVTLAEKILDGFEKQANGNFAIDATDTETLSFGDIDAVRGMYLETSLECKVRLNGSLDSIELKPAEAGVPAKLFLEGIIGQVDVENTSATEELTGVFVFWGDPT